MRSRWETMLHVPVRWAHGKRQKENDGLPSWEAPLEFLHAAFAHLLEEPDSTAPFNRLLGQIEEYIGASASVIFILSETGGAPVPWAWTPGTDCAHMRRLLDARPPSFEPAHLPLEEKWIHRNIMVVNLHHGDRRIGLLMLKVTGPPEELSGIAPLLQKLGGGIATMIHSAQRARINRTAALREERAAVARDLHDSLAQSLSYGKIQVSRLQSLLRGDRQKDSPWCTVEMDSIVQELRSNLNMAYRQLRDLITTCRLTMDGRNLDQALEDSVEEFGKRSGIVFELDNRVVGIKLKADEEMQALHIVREALSNIVRHSHASHAVVRLFSAADGTLSIDISDDGAGIATDRSGDPHHGLMIMQERTHRLGGDFSLGSNDDGGTSVSVRFMPRSVAEEQTTRARVRDDDIPPNRIDHR